MTPPAADTNYRRRRPSCRYRWRAYLCPSVAHLDPPGPSRPIPGPPARPSLAYFAACFLQMFLSCARCREIEDCPNPAPRAV